MDILEIRRIELKGNNMNIVTNCSIGAFYFGPINVSFSADTAQTEIESFEPIITINNYNSISVIADTANLFVDVFDPNIFSTKDIMVNFTGVPVSGPIPLTVLFTGIVTFKGNYSNIYKVNQYIWYFDVNNNPLVYEITTNPQINHIYTGVKGQTYKVRLEVTLEKNKEN